MNFRTNLRGTLKSNISAKEEAALSLVAESFISSTEQQLQKLIISGSIWEVNKNE